MKWQGLLLGSGAALMSAVAYLLLWPVPIEPRAWVAPPNAGHVGAHAPNRRLAGLQLIDIGQNVGPEHVVMRQEGGVQKLYAALASGAILRMNADGTQQEPFINTGGRVLGFDFDADGNLIAADAIKGLLSVSPAGVITVLANTVQVDGRSDPIRYADAVVVSRSPAALGKIYFSDASTRFGPEQFGGTFNASVLDILEQSATGRVLEYDPISRKTRVVLRGLSFANGVALSSDEQSLFVTETGRYRVWRVQVAAQNVDASAGESPMARVLLDNLPGYPDNLMRGLPTANGEAKLWLGFAKPRGAAADSISSKPWLKRVTLRLPRALWPVPPAYGHVVAFTESGKIVQNLQDPSGAYPETTGVTETPDRLYVQSLHANVLGWLPNTGQ